MRVLTSLIIVLAMTVLPVHGNEAAETVDAGSRVVASGPEMPVDPSQVVTPPDGDMLLYSNGSFVTHFGTGYHGANESWVQTNLGMDIYGFGNQASLGNRLADDFTVPPGQVYSIYTSRFWGYQTGSPTTSTLTALNIRIWRGTPGAGGTVVWGDTSTNRLSQTWSGNTYRVLDTDTGQVNDRPIMVLESNDQIDLGPGYYWIDWQVDGTLSSGPWVPPLTYMGLTTTGNAIQSTDGGSSWTPIVDTATNTPQGLPFDLRGWISSPNDTCNNAEVITCPPGGGTVTVYGDTQFASSTGSYSCGQTSIWGPEVWYRVTGTGGDITASTCTSFNQYTETNILVFDGQCSGLNCAAASDDNCSISGSFYLDTVTWTSAPGSDYYIAMDWVYPVDGIGSAQIDGQIGFELVVTCEANCTDLQTPTISGVGGVACGGTTSQPSPILTWYDVPNESGFRWELRDILGTVVRTGSVGANVTSADIGTLNPGTYIARVQAYGDDINFCDSQWSSSCSFDVAEPCEELVAPTVTSIGGTSCGGTTQEVSPVLTWTDSAHESGYEWEVRDSGGEVVADGSTGPDVTSVNVGTLMSGSFSVGVKAIGDGILYCDSMWSTHCPFEILEECEKLPLPIITSIGGVSCNGSTTETSPRLVWTNVAGEEGYNWEVRDDFGHLVKSGSTGPDVTTVDVGNLSPGNFIARVQAFGDGVEFCDSDWTSYCSFEVIGECQELEQPSVTSIGDTTCGGETFETSPIATWKDLDNETGYEWELRNDDHIVGSDFTSENESSVNLGVLEPDLYSLRVRAFGDGVGFCDSQWSEGCVFEVKGEIGVADFVWWPMQPKVGEHVRFADRATGEPLGWFWETGDGWTSTEGNPFHRFGASGDYPVSMECQYAGGPDTKIWDVRVSGIIRCGDELCEGEETAWSCPMDCGLPPDASGRAGGSDRRPSVPAAVGGVAGTGGTFWKTEGWVVNPGEKPMPIIFEYTPLGSTEIFTAGPFDLEPDNGLYWDNLVEDLFGATGNGALWVDAPGPVHFLTRSYNESSSGNFGQAVRGLKSRLTLAKGDGEVYLIGLRHDSEFRTNLFFQEVDGFWVTVDVEVYNEDGERVRLSTFNVEGHSNILKSLSSLGGGGQDSAYVTVRVVDGRGRLDVVGSVVDQISGDPTTVDPIHLDQVVVKHKEGTKVLDDAHHLVAVVAHTKGSQNSVWGTKFTVSSPKGAASQQVTFVYVPEYDRTGVVGDRLEQTKTLNGGRQRVWRDVLVDLFGLPANAKTQGALHVYSPGEVLISSRTYNRTTSGSTLGQNMKALAVGDLVDATTPGTIIGLSHRPGSRTNMGIAAFSDQDTEVEIRFFSNFPSFSPLGTINRTVEAESHLQIPKVFVELGLSNVPIVSVSAFVTVSDGGAVYAYASMVDNGSGDPTTLVATRND